MSHELEVVNGRIEMFSGSGVTPWHGLGKVVAGSLTSADAIAAAGLGWTVSKRVLQFGALPGAAATWSPVASHVATVRDDTGDLLGVVGADYSVIQNSELMQMVGEALAEAGIPEARFETAGALRGGRRVWALARLGVDAYVGPKGDRLAPYAMVATAHDGSHGLLMAPTSVRVVCANTHRIAMRDVRVSFVHSGKLRDRLPDVVAAWRDAALGLEQFTAQADRMARTPLDSAKFSAILEATVKAIIVGGTEEHERRRRQACGTVLNHLRGDNTAGYLGDGGSTWAGYQALDYWLQHEARKFRSSDTRFESVLLGEVANLKARAFDSLAA